MIIAALQDGLGNQLFQYAAARRLAYRHGTMVKLDMIFYERSGFRRYGLDAFKIDEHFATLQDIARLCLPEAFFRLAGNQLPGLRWSRFKKVLNRVARKPAQQLSVGRPATEKAGPLRKGRIVAERFHHFDPEVIDLPDNVILRGYWQSEKYFLDVEALIRNELSWRNPPSPLVEQMARTILGCESVSLHVRRGDKVSLGEFTYTKVEDCQKAMALLRSKVRAPVFFVFTDDWDWAGENLPAGPDLVHVRHNLADHEDLRLMSLCRHNIVAPSSFSWWGAWLNANPHKIVVRPRSIFTGGKHDSRDVFPTSWIALN